MKYLALLLLLLAGCATRTVTLPDGSVLYKSSRFGNKEQIKRIEFRHGADVFILEGYSSDQVEVLSAVTEAAVKAAISSAKP